MIFKPSLVVNSRTNIELSWNPAAILPLAEDATSFNVNVRVYSYDYDKRLWEKKGEMSDLPNSGKAMLGMVSFSRSNQATCIHVAVGQPTQTTSNVGQLVQVLNSASTIPFPYGVGLWTGQLVLG